MDVSSIVMYLGFVLASYSVVGNDTIQTLGTFLSSNERKRWWVLWAFAGGILACTLIFGYLNHAGDVSYGRLEKYPLPDPFEWYFLLPPIILLLLTRTGIPVSTSFLILTFFNPENLTSMVTKSVWGYVVAFVAALTLYFTISRLLNALKYSLMADSLAEKSGSELVSRTSGMVASQYRSLKLYDESIAYLQKALKNANRLKGTNVPTTKIMVYNELGAIHYEKADYEKTIETVKEQLALIAEAGQAFPDSSFQHMLAIHLRPAYLNLGRSYYELEELDSAKSYFSKAKDLYAQSRQPLPPWQETDLNIKLADIEIAEGDADTALAYLTTATSLVAELNDRELEHELDIVFNRYYELINDYQKSDSIKRKIIAHVADRHHSSAEASRYILQKEKANADLLKSKSDLLLVLLALTLLDHCRGHHFSEKK
ncbi:tetratricopeptide repeat protein [Parapedobacter luteus]|nr:hypothetical protein [Parapedobacter luteus]